MHTPRKSHWQYLYFVVAIGFLGGVPLLLGRAENVETRVLWFLLSLTVLTGAWVMKWFRLERR